MKLSSTISIFALAVAGASAAAPEGYYDSLEGKSGTNLVTAIRNLGSFKRVNYSSKAWTVLEKTDVREINGQKAWFDKYSNALVWLPEHDALNKEHATANSWWGGSKGNNDAYSDIHNLNPSNQDANNVKSNNPLGVVAAANLFDNGLVKVGTPAEGYGGGSKNVFEPADEYKGDFARTYFYMFTQYGAIDWMEDYAYMYSLDNGKPVLQDWAKTMLLEWNAADPVDSREMERNDIVQTEQGNRNPFVDFPGLADIIYGKANGAFHASELAAVVYDRPSDPVFTTTHVGNKEVWMTGVNTYNLRHTQPSDRVYFECDDPANVVITKDGVEANAGGNNFISLGDLTGSRESHVYTIHAHEGGASERNLHSSTVTLTVTGVDPSIKDYSLANWKLMKAGEKVTEANPYILLSPNTKHAMASWLGGSNKDCLGSAGFVRFDQDENVVELPVDAGVVIFSPSDGNLALGVYDTAGEFQGYVKSASSNKIKLDKAVATPGTAEVGDGGVLTFTFTDGGKFQFNKTQPRFSNYGTGKQADPLIYKFMEFQTTGVCLPTLGEEQAPIAVSGNTISAPAGSLIYDLNGRQVDGKAVAPGLYIVVTPNTARATKILIK